MNSTKTVPRRSSKKIIAKRRLQDGLITNANQQLIVTNQESMATSHNIKRSRLSELPATDSVVASLGTAVSMTESIADYESFVKAFAVPTHLYRYLATRRRSRPLFLIRNLRYMRSNGFQSNHSKDDKKISSVISKLTSQKEQLQNLSTNGTTLRPRRGTLCSSHGVSIIGASDIPSQQTVTTNIPDEVEFLIEGFFDSEKENDWVTVDAKLTLQSRLGWNWRRKCCQRDTIVPIGRDIACYCNPEGRGAAGRRPQQQNATSTTTSSFRFRPAEMLEAAAATLDGVSRDSVSSVLQRLNNAQMELKVRVKERRRAKHINFTSETAVGATALGHTSYVVHYSSAPLPLFYSSLSDGASTDTSSQQSPFLLSPGLYELRLGIQTDPEEVQDNSSVASSAMNLEGGSAVDGGDRVVFSGGGNGGASSSFRFPKLSAAVDEYSRWPRLRFQVLWHNNSNGRDSKSPLATNNPNNFRHRNNSDRGGSSAQRGSTLNSPSPSSPQSAVSPSLSKTQHKRPSDDSTATVDWNDVIRPVLIAPLSRKLRPPTDAPPPPPTFITYRFLYGGNEKRLRQWSETQDMICPWCKLNCRRSPDNSPSALLAHLRTSHPRFRFKANWNPRRQHLSLEVSLNASYDGSNDCSGGGGNGGGIRSQRISGGVVAVSSTNEAVSTTSLVETAASRNPNQLPIVGGWTGYEGGPEDEVRDAKKRIADAMLKQKKPNRRLPFTHLIYWRGAERLARQPLEAQLTTRQLAVGHNRVYFHTSTMQTISPTVFNDQDSEAEDAPEWLCQHYQRKVEEFTDINKGEKEMIQVWNAFLLSVKPAKTVVCDNQMTSLVMAFVAAYGAWLHDRGLRANLILHLTNLVDYGLVTPKVLRRALATFDEIASGAAAQRMPHGGESKPNVPVL